MKLVIANAPLLLAALLVVAFSADIPVLGPLKTESTFGWWLLGVPIAVLVLAGAQVALWLRRSQARTRGR